MQPRLFIAALAGLLSCAGPANAAALKISPELDPKSDKKFFGPPFPADYPDDLRPKGKVAFKHPYPHVQPSASYDEDYVKDENSDRGEWKAQEDYDALRNKLRLEKEEAEKALERKNKEAADLEKATEEYDDAAAAHKASVDQEFDKVPLDDRIERAQKKIKKIEEDCKKQLADAKAELKELMERKEKGSQPAAGTADMKAAKDPDSAHEAMETAKAKLDKEEREHEDALKSYEKEAADVKETEAALKAAEEKLRAIRHPEDANHRSGAPLSALSLLVAALTVAVVAH